MKLLPSDPFGRDIVIFLTIKLVLIFVIWTVFFRAPSHAPVPDVDAVAVQRALLERNPIDAASSAHSNASTKGQP